MNLHRIAIYTKPCNECCWFLVNITLCCWLELALIHILNYTRFTLANIIIVTPHLLPLCPVSPMVALIVPPCMIVSDRKLGGS